MEKYQSQKMFGGVCNLLNGNIFCGVYKDYLILRLGEKHAEDAPLNHPMSAPLISPENP